MSAADLAVDSEEQAMISGINAYRQQNGLGQLAISPTLNRAAAWMSHDLAATNYFSHTDSLGRDPFVRMADCGYGYTTSKGENLAAGYADAASTLNQWKNSSGHNANLLGSGYTAAGIARASSSSSTYGWYWTLDLGGYNDSGAATPTTTALPTSTATATPTPPALPAAPTSVQAGTITGSSIQVRWADNATNESRYEIRYQRSGSLVSTTATVSAGATSATLTGLQAGTTYTINVRACNAAGCSAWSSSISATTSSSSTATPSPTPTTRPSATPTPTPTGTATPTWCAVLRC